MLGMTVLGGRAAAEAARPLFSGIFVREGGARAAYEHLADDIASAVPRRRAGPSWSRTVA